MNELIHSESPYLLQHKAHPIHWKIWNDVNLETAIKEDKLLIISIGYSSCHWCHVMAHECFEDQMVAETMNTHFISFKIDREENPDIDAIYMNALQLMTRQGGWPLNIVALPNGYPIWGCTYLPKDQWIHQLDQLQKLYKEDKERVLEYADQLHQHLHLTNQLDFILDQQQNVSFTQLIDNWKKTFDWEYGGTDRAPKFIMPTHWGFLFEYNKTDNQFDKYIQLSLEKIALSGIQDPIEGGFYRYSVDHYWHIPHFEKMLYDQSQLISVYTQAAITYNKPVFQKTALSIYNFLINNWKSKDGGYYGSYDADSFDFNGKSVEGFYYTITKNELENLSKQNIEVLKYFYGISEEYLWEDNYFHLQNINDLYKTSQHFSISIDQVEQIIEAYHVELSNIRLKKRKPNLDTKIINSWNALLLSSFVDLFWLSPSLDLEKNIHQLFNYISTKCINEKHYIYHTDTQKEASPLLEDYAYCIHAFFKYYQITLDAHILIEAKQLLDTAIDLFYDNEQQFFLSHLRTQLHIVSQIEIEDNVIPSANSVMADNLYLAFVIFDNQYYKKIASTMIDKVTNATDSLSVYSNWYRLSLKWPNSFSYLISNDYSVETLHNLKRKSKDTNMFLIKNNDLLPISKNYKSMVFEQIQICGIDRCYVSTTNFNTLFNYK